jgi:hypothetical protein
LLRNQHARAEGDVVCGVQDNVKPDVEPKPKDEPADCVVIT